MVSESAEAAVREPSRWDRLSTGLKMWIILSVGLLPLGIVAVAASVGNAQANRDKALIEAQGLLAIHVQRYTAALSRNSFTIRAARDAIIDARDPADICARTLGRLGRPPNTPGRFALYGLGSSPSCVTPDFAPANPPPAGGEAVRPVLMPETGILLVYLYDPAGAVEGVAEYRRDALAEVVNGQPLDGDFALELVQGDKVMPLRTRASYGDGREVSADAPFANNQYVLRIRAAAQPMSPSEILAILAPILMWLWASLVGWILVQRLLLSPLGRIQRLIAAYRPGDDGLDLPDLRTPAREIGALGQAFAQVTRTVARHEAQLEAAVARQTRLVREVHHRVKNNLQVVASLLNLHARGAANDEVAAAYASIQRRVDALAVVHRNHFAELEENRGVTLKALISELAANLRATAPSEAAGMQVRLDVAALHVTQDVAVSVAFLITEIVEFGMLCGANSVSVVLEPEDVGAARLTVEIDSKAGAAGCDEALTERFDRIVTGLARQLRSALDRDAAAGRYSVRIAVMDGQSPA